MKVGEFNGDVDFNKNSLLNVAIEPVTALPTTDNFVGRMATLNGTPYWHDGSVWKSYPTTSGGSTPPPNVWWIGAFTSSTATQFQTISAASAALKTYLNTLGQNSINLRIEVFPGTYTNEVFEFPDGVELFFHAGASVTGSAPWTIRSGALGDFKVTGNGKFTTGAGRFFDLSVASISTTIFALIETGNVDINSGTWTANTRFIYSNAVNVGYVARGYNKSEIEATNNASLLIYQPTTGAPTNSSIWKVTMGATAQRLYCDVNWIYNLNLNGGISSVKATTISSFNLAGSATADVICTYLYAITAAGSSILNLSAARTESFTWNSTGTAIIRGGVMYYYFNVSCGTVKLFNVFMESNCQWGIVPTQLINIYAVGCSIRRAIYLTNNNFYGGGITFIKCAFCGGSSYSVMGASTTTLKLYDCYADLAMTNITVVGEALKVYAGMLF